MTAENTKHIYWIDILRVSLVLLVVFGHCLYTEVITDFGGIDYHNGHEGICRIQGYLTLLVNYVYTFHMPLFMAVSGACYALGFAKFKSFSELSSNKAKRLLVPFILVTVFYQIPIKYFSGYYVYSESILKDMLLGQILLMGNSHLWFLVALFICFMVFWCIYPFFKKNKVLVWFLLLLCCWSVPYIEIHYGKFLGLTQAASHLIYFSIGFFSIKWFSLIKVNSYLLIGSFVMNVACYLKLSGGMVPLEINSLDNLKNYVIATFSYSVYAIWGCFNFTYLCIYIAKKFPIVLNNRAFSYIHMNSYDIYLYSDTINYVFLGIIFSIESFNPFNNSVHAAVAFILRFILSLGSAMIVSWLLSKLIIIWRSISSNDQVLSVKN